MNRGHIYQKLRDIFTYYFDFKFDAINNID